MPRALINSIWQPIKSLFIKIGQIQTVIIMATVYFVFIGPMAILYQLFNRGKSQRQKGYWVKKELIVDMDFYLRKQF